MKTGARGCVLLVTLMIGWNAPAKGQNREPSVAKPGFGLSDVILYHVGHNEFSPASSLTTYGETNGRYATLALGAFTATPHIPNGALLTSLEFDYCDNSVSNHHVTLVLGNCDLLLDGCIVMTGGQSTSNGCASVTFDMSGLAYTVQNHLRTLLLQANTASGDETNQIVGAFIGYKLQVSPAPATATFSDVPTTSPQFRFVEALFAAGITAGCGGGNFCPDQPLTRGQMAVFLSAALGLQFPN